ncbi:hypothetical protein ES705_30878 [subsurface metagenome]
MVHTGRLQGDWRNEQPGDDVPVILKREDHLKPQMEDLLSERHGQYDHQENRNERSQKDRYLL